MSKCDSIGNGDGGGGDNDNDQILTEFDTHMTTINGLALFIFENFEIRVRGCRKCTEKNVLKRKIWGYSRSSLEQMWSICNAYDA